MSQVLADADRKEARDGNSSLVPTGDGGPGAGLELQPGGSGFQREMKRDAPSSQTWASWTRSRPGCGSKSRVPEPCATMAQEPQQGLLPARSSQGSAPPGLPAPASWPISVLRSPLSHDERTLLPPQDLE